MSDEKKREKDQNKKKARCTIGRKFMHLKMKTLLKIVLSSVIGPLILYGMFFVYSHHRIYLRYLCEEPSMVTKEDRPKFWVYARSNNTGYLKHVHAVLQRLGFQKGDNESDWDLLWAHDYPFRALSASLRRLQEHQRVNHFPGCGYITNKVDLSTSRGRYIPAAFKMPEDRQAFLDYARSNPAKRFVQKSNDHRNIRIRGNGDVNFTAGTFLQEFIERPFLVDGYKFDVGVYTVITSVDPLRVYVYKADVLFRFCPIEYYPFDPENLDKYVVGDDYLPIWNVSSLRRYYTELGYSMKDSFDAYVRERGKNPSAMWDRVYDAIREVALMKEAQIREVSRRFGNGRNFFELARFDLALDEDLNVYMMEANMSPNLSSAHYPPNQLLYEQVIFNTFALVGIGKRIKGESLRARSKTEEEMEVADKNVVVLPELCEECADCFRVECQLCRPCFTPETKLILSRSYLEHQNRMDFQRIFPPPITRDMVLRDYTLRNQLLVRWYQGKCELDKTWCN